jgi:hypothetical protein
MLYKVKNILSIVIILYRVLYSEGRKRTITQVLVFALFGSQKKEKNNVIMKKGACSCAELGVGRYC